MGSRITVAIGELCSFSKGASVPRARMLDEAEWKYIHYGDLYKGFDLYIDIDKPSKPIPCVSAEERARDEQFVQSGDIVYVLTSETVDDLGHAFLVRNAEGYRVLSGTETTVMRVERQDLVMPAYLNYLLHTARFKKLLRQYVTGMKVFRVHPRDVSKIEIDIPSLNEQRIVVSTLDKIYDKLAINTQLNGYLGKMLLTKYDQLFNPFDRDACNGTLADIGEIVGGATPSKKKPEYYCHNGIGWITPRDLSTTTDTFIAHGADDITQEGYDSCSTTLIPEGSVLFSSRAPIGYIAIAAESVATNQGFKSVVPHVEIGTAFVYCFLRRNRQRIADMGSGTTFPEISGKMMKSVELALPSVDKCAEFSVFAGPILKMLRSNEVESHYLAKFRDALLPKFMSSEIDVSKVDLTQPNHSL